jgi:hypothetical protein
VRSAHPLPPAPRSQRPEPRARALGNPPIHRRHPPPRARHPPHPPCCNARAQAAESIHGRSPRVRRNLHADPPFLLLCRNPSCGRINLGLRHWPHHQIIRRGSTSGSWPPKSRLTKSSKSSVDLNTRIQINNNILLANKLQIRTIKIQIRRTRTLVSRLGIRVSSWFTCG